MKRFKIFSKKTIIGGSVIFVSFLFILMAFAPALSGAGQTATPATAEKSYIPNPTLNSNVSWSTFYNGWTPLEYHNTTANRTLNTGLSTIYQNPISVNPAKIKTNLANTYDGINLYNTANWRGAGNGLETGSIQTITNTSHSITYSINETDASSESNYFYISIPTTDLPSNNVGYDYITIGGNFTGYTGMSFTGMIGNSTDNSQIIAENGSVKTIYTGPNGIPIQNPAITEPFWFSVSLKAVNLTMGTSNIKIGIGYFLPQSTADQVFSATINNIAITEYPLTLGTETINGGKKIVSGTMGNAQLSTYNTSFSWKEITNNGYAVSVSQTLQNITESQTSISDGSYVEEATYQGTLNMQTAPDLTYRTTNITLNMAMPGDQYTVATLNGVSYLSAIQAQKNGTFSFGTVNPNSPNSMILEAKYTASQWDASTHAPSFFTLRGLEYYWWVGVIGGLSIIGLGAAGISHFGGDEETLRVPKGKFGR